MKFRLSSQNIVEYRQSTWFYSVQMFNVHKYCNFNVQSRILCFENFDYYIIILYYQALFYVNNQGKRSYFLVQLSYFKFSHGSYKSSWPYKKVTQI